MVGRVRLGRLGMGRVRSNLVPSFGAVEKPYLGFIPSIRRVQEVNKRMSSWPAIRARHASYLTAHLLVFVRCISRLNDLFIFAIMASTGNIRFSPPFSFFTPRLDGSGVILYEYEKREKFEDCYEKADAELGTIMIRRYHFDDEYFIYPLHSVRFDPDRSYEIPIDPLLADQLHSSSGNGKSSTRGPHPSRYRVQHRTTNRGDHHQPVDYLQQN
ncbi:hypothetical protein PIB30_072763 [Stylosanthes scabra]|uniref:Uncharacterized protein n=1 Tax=Stylosanthes scabra TaxID=79078 RepID=A0ABU6TNU6_9FABA|nr:hypothetical protein [Stylosanthes scabra]